MDIKRQICTQYINAPGSADKTPGADIETLPRQRLINIIHTGM